MKIKMKVLAAGPNGVLLAGGIYDLPEKEAKAFIDGNCAELAKEAPAKKEESGEPETAVDKNKPEIAGKNRGIFNKKK